jgi:hypothetical protein
MDEKKSITFRWFIRHNTILLNNIDFSTKRNKVSNIFFSSNYGQP